jgi:hypothetical protein
MFYQSFETSMSIPYAAKAVTISFYARKGANYSPTSSILNVQVATYTGTDQNMLDYATYNDAINQNATLTTTWQRFTYTGTVPTAATELSTAFNFTPTGVAGAADYFEVTGVQLELGSYATTFSRAGGTIQGELAACQRYYQRWTTSNSGGNLSLIGVGLTTSTASTILPYEVQMRITPTAIDYASAGLAGAVSGTFTGGTWTLFDATQNFAYLKYTHGSAALTVSALYLAYSSSTNAGYLGLSSEL